MSDEALDRIADALFVIAGVLQKAEPFLDTFAVVLAEEAAEMAAQALEKA
jgi:hypothetical protein